MALISQPFGFLRLPLKISLYNSILLLLIASSNVIVIIIGTSLLGKSPGIVVPSSEQKQSGNTHTAGSHGGARLGSLSMSANEKHLGLINVYKQTHIYIETNLIMLYSYKYFFKCFNKYLKCQNVI